MNRRRATARLMMAAAVMTLTALAPGCRQPSPPPAPPAPPQVLYSFPVKKGVTDFEDFTGRVEALKSVEVRARVTGYLERFLFEEGREVKEGDVLFEIDARPYRASLDQAVAEVAQTQAQLAKAEADFSRARGTYQRQAISQSEYDVAHAALDESKASVGIAVAKRNTANLNYEWTKVHAPISGQVSRRMVDPGNLVQADVTPLTSIVFTEQVYVNFDIDERTILRLRRLIREGKMRSRDQKELDVYAALVDEDPETFPHKGVVDFSDNRVDPGTGTLRLRGVFDNPPVSTAPTPTGKFVRRIMSPGLFARVRLPIGDPHEALLVPEQAIGSDQGQKYVFLINKDDEIVRSDVTVGALHGRLRVVEKGVGPEDRVVVSGIQRVRAKMKVRPASQEEFVRTGGATKGEKGTASPRGTPAPQGSAPAQGGPAPAKSGDATKSTAGPSPAGNSASPGGRP